MGYVIDKMVRPDAGIQRSKLALQYECVLEEEFDYPAGTTAGFIGANLKFNSAVVGASTVAAANPAQHGGIVKLTTQALLNASAQLMIRDAFWDLDYKPVYEFIFRLPAITTVVAQVGLYKDANNYALATYNSASAYWQFISNAAGAGAVTTVSAFPAAANILYHLKMQPGNKATTFGISAILTPLQSVTGGGQGVQLASSAHALADDDAQVPSFYVRAAAGNAMTLDADSLRVSVGRFYTL